VNSKKCNGHGVNFNTISLALATVWKYQSLDGGAELRAGQGSIPAGVHILHGREYQSPQLTISAYILHPQAHSQHRRLAFSHVHVEAFVTG
jgi:hypothetical protein